MQKTLSVTSGAGPQPDFLKLRKLLVKLGNAYVRLTAAERRRVMQIFQQFAFGKNHSASYWEHWSNDGMQCCYLQLKPISPKMANDFRSWALELLRTGHNHKVELKCLMDDLVVRTWIEEP